MSDSGSEAGDLFGGSNNSRENSPARSTTAPAQEPAETEEQDVGDLFGDDDDEEEAPRRREATSDSQRSGSRTPNPLEYAEEDEDAGPGKQNVVTIAVPQWPHLSATDGKIWQMKLPAYINLDSQPFDSDHYRATAEEAPDGTEKPLAAKSHMIGVKNTIRWRWATGPDGEPTRQSNARMLRWSDGSVSLQLGDDLYDLAPSHGTTLSRPSDPIPPTKTREALPPAQNTSTTFLCVGAAAERVLVTEKPIAGQLNLLPTSMQSKTYLELVKHVGAQHTKHSRMKMLEETQDEDALQELLLRSAPNREAIKGAKATTSKRAGASKGTGGKGKKARKIGYSDTESEAGYSGDERPKRGAEREAVEYEDDDGFVVDDSDSDDGYSSKKKGKGKSKSKGRKRKGGFTDDEEEDEMEAAERRIEAREREKKRARKEKSGAGKKSRDYIENSDEEGAAEGAEEDGEGEEEMDMDVESEED
ncbi:hypothetical protein IAR50_004170 [Cryptococcus sp. DSM 104548]